jgi:hypothetical protein
MIAKRKRVVISKEFKVEYKVVNLQDMAYVSVVG